VWEQIPDEVRNAAPGMAGSAVALIFLRRPFFMSLGIFIGGCLIAHFGTRWLATVLSMETAEGLVGFLLGSFAMALVARTYDFIGAINPTDVWDLIKDIVRKWFGVGGSK